MPLHLSKYAAPFRSQDLLIRYLGQYTAGGTKRVAVRSRNAPNQAEKIINGGSLYWISSDLIMARQPVQSIDEVEVRGAKYVQIILSPEVIPVEPTPCKAHSDWRYLKPSRAPRDKVPSDPAEIDTEMPAAMRRQLANLGLI